MLEHGTTRKDPSRRLAEINRAISSSLNFAEVLDLIVENALQLVGARIAVVLLLDRQNKFRIQEVRGCDPKLIEEFSGRMDEDVVNDLRTALKLGPQDTLVSVPIITKESLSGLLVVVNPTAIDPDAEWQLSAMADQAAIALENARLYELELEELNRVRDASHLALLRLAAIVESSDDAIVSKDLDGVINSWNAGSERIFGYPADEAIGKSIMMLIPADRQNEEVEIVKKLRRGERIEHFETVRVRKDGQPINVSLTISPIKNPQGQVIGASKIARDITESKRAEEALRRALDFDETVMSSMGEGLYTVDLESRVTFMNPAAQEMFGWTLDEILGRRIHEVVHHSHRDGAPFPAEECAGLRVLREGQGLSNYEDVFIRKDGTFFDVIYSSSPLRSDGRTTGLAVVFRDISERKQAEEERERLLAAEQDARAEAERANRLKDEFLATLSHELRNPLNVVIGYAEILRRSGENQKPEFIMKAAETIRRNAVAQAQLVSDLLDLSRLQMGKLSLNRQPVSLSTIISDAIETVRSEAAAKSITLQVDLDADIVVVEGDPIRLGQIAWNLLNNAIKFTPAEGTVRIALSQESGSAKVTIADSGQGISAEFLPYVFEMFRQADASSARRQGGMGIGLALVKQLAELHGGRVAAESEGTGQGASFTVWIPLFKEGESALKSENTGATGALRRKFILVVDDSPETTEMLGKLLELEGAFVELARSGIEALDIAKRKRFDLVVSDISMPEMDGYELLKSLRELPEMENVPAVALTGYGRNVDIDRAKQEGFAEHLTKPLDIDKLLKIVRELTEERVGAR
ncbi:MAG TPA: PAS domain S-box protein [Pyrinomonadaceae bacterium]|nr:PAS domain S-box protein [Pyrinomonadaceae bacterium]